MRFSEGVAPPMRRMRQPHAYADLADLVQGPRRMECLALYVRGLQLLPLFQAGDHLSRCAGLVSIEEAVARLYSEAEGPLRWPWRLGRAGLLRARACVPCKPRRPVRKSLRSFLRRRERGGRE